MDVDFKLCEVIGDEPIYVSSADEEDFDLLSDDFETPVRGKKPGKKSQHDWLVKDVDFEDSSVRKAKAVNGERATKSLRTENVPNKEDPDEPDTDAWPQPGPSRQVLSELEQDTKFKTEVCAICEHQSRWPAKLRQHIERMHPDEFRSMGKERLSNVLFWRSKANVRRISFERVRRLFWRCPEVYCSHVTTRRALLRAHAEKAHRVPVADLDRYMEAANGLVKRGDRETSYARVLSLMGAEASSPSHRNAVLRVLEAHSIVVRDQPAGASSTSISRPAVRSRRETSKQLEASGLATGVKERDLCDSAKMYICTQRERRVLKPATIMAHAKSLHRYVTFGLKHLCTLDERRVLVEPQCITAFHRTVVDFMAPSTMRNHAAALIDCLTLGLTYPDFILFRKVSKQRIRHVLNGWKTLKRDYDRRERRGQIEKINSSNIDITVDIFEIIQALETLKSDIDRRMEILTEIPDGATFVPKELIDHWKVVTCVVASYLLLQAVRLSTALNLTIAEVLTATKCQGHYVLRIMTNKTSTTRGAATVALRKKQFLHLKSFAEIRAKMNLGNCLIVTATGREATSVLEPLSRIIHRNLTFNNIRVFVETHSYLTDDPKEKQKSISSYLCHTGEVASKYYRFKADQVVINESMTVQNVLFQAAALDIVRKRNLLPNSAEGSFPSKSTLDRQLDEILCGTDLASFPLSLKCYEQLRDAWTEEFRDEAVSHYASVVLKSGLKPLKPLIAKVINDVWSKDRADLCSLVQERVLFLKTSGNNK
ncbi:Putative zinc finger protein [Frankliniella fusca]|uniref:Zinc finger protein n=1 Tax=Frankliniella fusca TaxID=407009 RepID=A0AAE1HA18_9NEOP|nr:Putative zinc finger protein [Frankliniella fusca]